MPITEIYAFGSRRSLNCCSNLRRFNCHPGPLTPKIKSCSMAVSDPHTDRLPYKRRCPPSGIPSLIPNFASSGLVSGGMHSPTLISALGRASNTTARTPRRASVIARAAPAGPPPTIIVCCGRKSLSLYNSSRRRGRRRDVIGISALSASKLSNAA